MKSTEVLGLDEVPVSVLKNGVEQGYSMAARGPDGGPDAGQMRPDTAQMRPT
ncbi:Hypothetical protein FKW44_010880 [Caligus rogercresseyi]|uniref:Uncharacterized protein n=1 Tax=Caligus rogercresseyi TaxID=217165 RepID=A0A7T8HHG4_CALRO|nr:Hypothetical protein FKW44_010880 [Caligus rogercresseyi]